MDFKRIRFELHGGIGNQLFQIAAGNYYEMKVGVSVYFDISHINRSQSENSTSKFHKSYLVDFGLHRFQIVGGPIKLFYEKVLRKLPMLKDYFDNHVMSPKIFGKSYESKEVGFDSKLENVRASKIFGYFQTYKYCSDDLRVQWSESFLKRNEPSWVRRLLIDLEIRKILVLHARFFRKELENVYLELDSHYYLSAILEHEKTCSFDEIWLLTNDVNFARSNFSKELLDKIRIIEQPSYVEDLSILHLMVAAQNLVISNSTFSWWGAFLGSSEKKVVAPRKIFASRPNPIDYYPMGWRLLP